MLEADIRKLRPISADSHVTELPDCYAPWIDKKFKDRAPNLVNDMDDFARLGANGAKAPLDVILNLVGSARRWV